MPTYATENDLLTWMDTDELGDDVHATPLLRKASLLVATACRLDSYDTTPTGIPSDDDLADAMREATCAQAERWLAADVNPVAGSAQSGVVASSSVDGASVSFVTPTTADTAAMTDTLCPDALHILRLAGLATSAVW